MKKTRWLFGRQGRFLLRLPRVICLLISFIVGGPALAQQEAPEESPIKAVTILTVDDEAKPLNFPSTVFFDKTMEETYVVSAGRRRVVVYGPDYFPQISLGAGRGVDAPYGLYVDVDGRIYICQSASAEKPPRLTVFNAAFFLEKEIDLQGMAGDESFTPRRLVQGLDGIMYVAGLNTKGVLVLDQDGDFLRWLTPIDRLWTQKAEVYTSLSRNILQERPSGETSASARPDSQIEEEFKTPVGPLGLPPELLPRLEGADILEEKPEQRGPVKIIDIATDSQGRIYLLSEETSKVYVYSAKEEFLFSFGQKGGSTGKMSRPKGFAVDETKGAVYIADYMRHTVLVYDLTGQYLFEFGGRGWGPGWFNYPISLAVDRKGHLIVADLFNQRVQVLDVPVEARFRVLGPKITGPQGPYPTREEQQAR